MATNLFTPNQSDVEWGIAGFYVAGNQSSGSGPFTGGGVTITQDATQVWHGASALKITTDGTSGFQALEVRIPVAGQFVAGATYTLSAYLYSAVAGPTLRFYCQASTGNIGTVGSITLAVGWNRFSVTVTLPNPITQTFIGLRFDTGSVAQAITYWADGLQCEQVATASAWTLGSGSVVAAAGASLLASAALSLSGAQVVSAVAASIALLASAVLNAVATIIVLPTAPPKGVSIAVGATSSAPSGVSVALATTSAPSGVTVTTH